MMGDASLRLLEVEKFCVCCWCLVGDLLIC